MTNTLFGIDLNNDGRVHLHIQNSSVHFFFTTLTKHCFVQESKDSCMGILIEIWWQKRRNSKTNVNDDRRSHPAVSSHQTLRTICSEVLFFA